MGTSKGQQEPTLLSQDSLNAGAEASVTPLRNSGASAALQGPAPNSAALPDPLKISVTSLSIPKTSANSQALASDIAEG